MLSDEWLPRYRLLENFTAKWNGNGNGNAYDRGDYNSSFALRAVELKTSQQSLAKFCLLVLKILSGNEILTSIKGRNSVANLQNLTLYFPNLDIINVNVYTKFG